MKSLSYRQLLIPLIISAALCGLPASPAARADEPVALEAKTDRTGITIGDPILYTVSAVYDKEYHVEFPPPGSMLGEFEIRDYRKIGPVKLADGRMEIVHEYTIAVYSTGNYEIPPVEVAYWKREDEKDTLKTRKIEIVVKTLVGKEAKDIQDLKEPLEVPFPYLRYGLIAGGILAGAAALIMLLIILLRRARGRRKTAPGAAPARREPPHTIALRELDALAAGDLLKEGRIKEFYIELSETLRRYVAARYGVATMERTTDEIVSDLLRLNLPRAHTGDTGSFLRDADMVKFAKVRPGPDACRDDLARTRRIVETTTEKAA